MALSIKDPETDRLARELAAATGESITVAARRAIEERLARVRGRQAAPDSADVLQQIIVRGRGRPMLDARSNEDVVGYDEQGIPA